MKYIDNVIGQWYCSYHCKSFTGAGLAIRQNAHIVAIQGRFNQRFNFWKDLFCNIECKFSTEMFRISNTESTKFDHFNLPWVDCWWKTLSKAYCLLFVSEIFSSKLLESELIMDLKPKYLSSSSKGLTRQKTLMLPATAPKIIVDYFTGIVFQ